MSSPIISVVTVCRNAISDIRKTINSVLAQYGVNFEYIVIDGASTDGTLDAILSYEREFRIRGINFIHISEKDRGTYDAMNKGCLIAQGEWVSFLNAGDVYYSPTTLTSVFDCKVSDVGVIYGDTIEQYRFGSVLVADDGRRKIDTVMPFCHQASFVRRDLLLKYQFDLSYRILSDHHLFYRLRCDGIRFLHRNVIVCVYNAQYGLSADNPLLVQLERHKIYGQVESPFYFIRYLYTFIRSGFLPLLKKWLPGCFVDFVMKYRRR